MPELFASVVARPLVESLGLHPFKGHVFGLFERACNLVDARQRVIAVTAASLAKGPFSILIEDGSDFFQTIVRQQAGLMTPQTLTVGPWQIHLSAAEIWQPEIAWPTPSYQIPAEIRKILTPYTEWPLLPVDTPVVRGMGQLARQAARQLQQALIHGENIVAGVTGLAGLGGGLTPAGDDYLVGAMAALWLTGRSHLPPQMARLAAPRTTTLSAAFLNAAGQGQFLEPWHTLVAALIDYDPAAVQQAVHHVAQFGASSGTDALAGFAGVLAAGGAGGD